MEGAWGAFLCIRESLDVSEVPELDADAEIIWAKVSLSKRSPVYVCSFYHPPDQSTDLIVQLDSSLNILIQRSANLPIPNIIVMGDFNLPSINWVDGCGQIKSHPSYGADLNNSFLDLVNDIGLNQFVNTPKRNSNILDLVLSTSTSILNLTTTPGMSDHEAIVFYYTINNANLNTKPDHKVAL